MESDKKIYYTYENIHSLVKNVAKKIKTSNFEPDVLIAIGGGGYILGRILRNEYKKPLIGVSVNYYDENDKIQEKVNVFQWIEKKHVKNKNILIIDEVDDTRKTLHFIVEKMRKYKPKEIAIAVLNNKKKEKEPLENVKYFCSEETEDKWIVYPWDYY